MELGKASRNPGDAVTDSLDLWPKNGKLLLT